MSIAEEDIARVRQATDFVALAGEHMALRRVGTRWVGRCPFHAEKTPSFSVNSELGLYYCFGCGASGDAITFVREIEHLDFASAVEKLAAKAGITLRYEREQGVDHRRRNRIHQTLEAAIEFYHQRLLSSPDAAAARAYLRRERGYDGEVVRRWKLGWAPDARDALVRGLSLAPAALVDAGLATLDSAGRPRDFFRARVLFPIYEAGGRPVGFGGRCLPGGPPPKYKNTPATAVYDKGRVLYGLDQAKKAVVAKGRVVVCEGYTDVIGLASAGIEEAVATCGTALAEGHVKLLSGFARQIVLAYDADGAGQAAAERFWDWEKRFSADIRVAALPPGSDPADLALSDPERLRQAVEQATPFLGFRLSRLFSNADLAHPEGRARAASQAVELVAQHPSAEVADQYLMEVADRTRVPPERLRQLHERARSARGGPDRPGERRAQALEADGALEGQVQKTKVADVALPGPEREALRLAVQRPADMAAYLRAELFSHPLARSALDALSSAQTLHQAINEADPQTGELIRRLAVEPTDSDPAEVARWLVVRAGRRCLDQLGADMRAAAPEAQRPLGQEHDWAKRLLDLLGSEAGTSLESVRQAQEALVGWLVQRQGSERLSEASR